MRSVTFDQIAMAIREGGRPLRIATTLGVNVALVSSIQHELQGFPEWSDFNPQDGCPLPENLSLVSVWPVRGEAIKPSMWTDVVTSMWGATITDIAVACHRALVPTGIGLPTFLFHEGRMGRLILLNKGRIAA